MMGLGFVMLAVVTLGQPEAGHADEAGVAEAPVQASSTVGIEGQVLLRVDADGPSLVARPADYASAVVLRIADSVQDGDAVIYDVRFIAQRAGRLDLREFLERADGSAAMDLEPIVIEVGSLLPEEHTGDLFAIGGLALPRLGGYRALMVVAGLVWIAPVGWVVARRLRPKPAVEVEEVGRPRTLGDQLRPLVDAAIAGELSTEKSARLEMLLLAYWRRHRHLDGLSPAAALAELRTDSEAGELLLAMESWLHMPPESASEVDITGLLARYREIEPIELGGQAEPVDRVAEGVGA